MSCEDIAMSELAISANGLGKKFKVDKGWVTAVNGVSLQVAPGETYGLIGPDGAGKTTTTRLILGLLSRTAGESSILGFDSMRDIYEIRERVGYIAQQNVLPADLTVMDYAFLCRHPGHVPRRTEETHPGTAGFCWSD
jgi:ABC-type multidrug transport system ATPase subunit